MRTPRDSTYARVAAGGDYDADWEEHYAPPPPPNLKRAAQAPKKIATVGAAGPDRWARDDYYTADPYQSFAPLEVDSELSSSEDGTPRKATVQPTPPRDSPVDVWAVDDFDERGDSQASLSERGDDENPSLSSLSSAASTPPRTTCRDRPRFGGLASPADSWSTTPPSSPPQTPPPMTPVFVAAGRRPVWMCKGACARCGDTVWSNEPRVRVGRGYAHVRCPRAFDYYATTAAAAFRPRMSPASPADSWSTTPPSSPPQDYYASTASAVVGAGSPLQRLDSVQIDPLPRVYSFEAMASRSL